MSTGLASRRRRNRSTGSAIAGAAARIRQRRSRYRRDRCKGMDGSRQLKRLRVVIRKPAASRHAVGGSGKVMARIKRLPIG